MQFGELLELLHRLAGEAGGSRGGGSGRRIRGGAAAAACLAATLLETAVAVPAMMAVRPAVLTAEPRMLGRRGMLLFPSPRYRLEKYYGSQFAYSDALVFNVDDNRS